MRIAISVGAAVLLFAGFAPRPGETAAAPTKGVGPVKQITLGPIDRGLAARGERFFEQKCSACHKFEERYVGPALGGVTKRRAPEWIMNMILNPQEMTEKDPAARDLLAEYLTQMTFQNVTEADARAILEYARSMDETGGTGKSAPGKARKKNGGTTAHPN